MKGLKKLLGESYRDDLTIEEIDKFISGKDLIDRKTLARIPSKDDFDKLSSQIAEYKRKEREKLNEEEKLKAELTDQLNDLKSKLEQSERLNRITSLKAKYLSLGYDETLALNSATASIEQDYDKLFEYHQKFLENHKENITKDILSVTPRPENVSNESQAPDYYKQLSEARKNGNNLEAVRIIEEATKNGLNIR
jgi:predicted nuclease with TOPRIM domain